MSLPWGSHFLELNAAWDDRREFLRHSGHSRSCCLTSPLCFFFLSLPLDGNHEGQPVLQEAAEQHRITWRLQVRTDRHISTGAYPQVQHPQVLHPQVQDPQEYTRRYTATGTHREYTPLGTTHTGVHPQVHRYSRQHTRGATSSLLYHPPATTAMPDPEPLYCARGEGQGVPKTASASDHR